LPTLDSTRLLAIAAVKHAIAGETTRSVALRPDRVWPLAWRAASR
jgi:hypothetical protein